MKLRLSKYIEITHCQKMMLSEENKFIFLIHDDKNNLIT